MYRAANGAVSGRRFPLCGSRKTGNYISRSREVENFGGVDGSTINDKISLGPSISACDSKRNTSVSFCLFCFIKFSTSDNAILAF